MSSANYSVRMVSGETFDLQSSAEVKWYETTRDLYMAECQFTETTDLRDLDRLLGLELIVHRMMLAYASGTNNDGVIVEEKGYQRDIKLMSAEITKVKDSMGLSKKARDDEANSGSVSQYIEDLRHRARAFGIHRSDQLRKALVLMNELSSLVRTFDQADAEERQRFGIESEGEILDWVRQVMIPEFHELDLFFQQHEQTTWVRKM